jgi:hypothetical protein
MAGIFDLARGGRGKRKADRNPTGLLTEKQLKTLRFIGVGAIPGAGERSRQISGQAGKNLSREGLFANIPSSGGFTVLGRNALGQKVARDNVTGKVRPLKSLVPISPTARSIGEQGTPQEVARSADVRRKSVRQKSTTAPKVKTPLGGSQILGTQSILG